MNPIPQNTDAAKVPLHSTPIVNDSVNDNRNYGDFTNTRCGSITGRENGGRTSKRKYQIRSTGDGAEDCKGDSKDDKNVENSSRSRNKRKKRVSGVGGSFLRSVDQNSTGTDSEKKQRKRSVHDQMWEDKYNLLREFKYQFGHCEVLRRYLDKEGEEDADHGTASEATTLSDSNLSRFSPLIRWISFIRQQWDLYDIHPSKSTCLSEERIGRLKQLGFVRYPTKGKSKNSKPPPSIVAMVNRQAQQQRAAGSAGMTTREVRRRTDSNADDDILSASNGKPVGSAEQTRLSMSGRDIKWEQKFHWLLQYKQGTLLRI